MSVFIAGEKLPSRVHIGKLKEGQPGRLPIFFKDFVQPSARQISTTEGFNDGR